MPTDILQRYQDMLKNRKEQDARLAELMPVDTKTAGNTLNSYEQALQEAKQAQDILKLKAEEAKVNKEARKLHENQFSDFNLTDPSNDQNYEDVISRFLPKAPASVSGQAPLTPNDLSQMSVNPSVQEVPKGEVQVSKNVLPKSPVIPSAPKSPIIPLVSKPEVKPIVDTVSTKQSSEMTDEQKLEEAKRQRDIMAAMGLISKGISQASAGYGGGSVTQLKPDTSAAEMLTQMGEQGVTDIKDVIKSKQESNKQRIEDLLKKAQAAKFEFDASGKMTDKEKADDAYKKAMLGIENRKLDIEKIKALADAKKKAEGIILTKGEEARDRNFSKEYLDWNSTGKATFDKNIKRLEDAKNELAKVKDDLVGTSGRLTGRLPNLLRSEKSLQLQQDVQSAAQMGLRQTLGAQFTEKEGERIMGFSYDPTLSPDANIKKIDATIAELKSGAKAKDDMSQHFEKTGTLKGFSTEASPNTETSQSSGPYGQEVERNGKTYIWNPSVGKYQIK